MLVARSCMFHFAPVTHPQERSDAHRGFCFNSWEPKSIMNATVPHTLARRSEASE